MSAQTSLASVDVPRVEMPRVEIRPSGGLFDLDLRAVWNYRGLLFYLVWRELKVRYSQASLGAAWAIIQPVFAVIIFTVVFGMFGRIPSDGVPYAVFVFAGMLPWTYFAEATRRCSVGLVGDADLIRKIYFPRLIIPLAMVITPLIDFLAAFVVFIGVMMWYDIMPSWHLLLVPPLMVVLMTLALSVGLWLGPVNVRYRDVMQTLPFVLQIWMYASPVIYPLSMIPQEWRAYFSLNPMVGMIDLFRWAFIGKGDPHLLSISITLVAILILFVSGLLFFKHMERGFADVI